MQRFGGKLVVLGMAVLGGLLAAYACYHQMQQGRQILAVWGPEDAQRIRHAERVELLRLGADGGDAAASTLRFGSEELFVAEPIDISTVPGLVHARHALIEDASYRFDAVADVRPNWVFGLRFLDDSGSVVLLFDPRSKVVARLDDARTLVMSETIDRLYGFIRRYWAE